MPDVLGIPPGGGGSTVLLQNLPPPAPRPPPVSAFYLSCARSEPWGGASGSPAIVFSHFLGRVVDRWGIPVPAAANAHERGLFSCGGTGLLGGPVGKPSSGRPARCSGSVPLRVVCGWYYRGGARRWGVVEGGSHGHVGHPSSWTVCFLPVGDTTLAAATARRIVDAKRLAALDASHHREYPTVAAPSCPPRSPSTPPPSTEEGRQRR